MDTLRQKFIEDATDLTATLEQDLLTLEKDNTNRALIQQVFRAMHSLKGVSGMYGFDNIGEITHDLETIYDFVREGKITLSKPILDLTFEAVDHIKILLQISDEMDAEVSNKHSIMLEKIAAMVAGVEKKTSNYKSVEQKSVPVEKKESEFQSFFISFRPFSGIFERGINIFALFQELVELGACKIIPFTNPIPHIKAIGSTKCYIYWEIYLSTKKEQSDIEDILIFVQDECQLQLICQRNIFEIPNISCVIENFSRSTDNIDSNKINKLLQNLEEKPKPQQTHKDNTPPTKSVIENYSAHKITSIRVSSEKLDELMNLVSEFVTTQAELSLISENLVHARLQSVAENIEKLSRQLRDNAFSICLIPVNEMLVKYQRLVRDLSAELKKDVAFVTEGTDTELDKTIVEGLADPLLHILRNSIDHGIEFPDVRKSKGKHPRGTILFKAYHEGSHVYIKITDDGAGINVKKIRDVALRRGYISSDANLTERELVALIFHPGFTTSDNVSEVSGRGVGMDVVKRKIADIRGEIVVESKTDLGTTITIQLPITLSIVDALLVKINDENFLIPLTLVDFCSEIEHCNLMQSANNRIIIENELLPFVYLRNEFEINGECPQSERIVVVRYDNKRIALVVDVVMGEHQAVLKPLGEVFKMQQVISGASILGDGDVALVIDTNKLIKNFSGKTIRN